MSDHVTPPTDERIKELRRKLSLPERMDGNDWFDIGAILDDYSSLRAENERLRADVEHWRRIDDVAVELEKAEAQLAALRREAAKQAPLVEADVQNSIHLSKSVEEAMGRISEIMEDRIHSMQSHASVYGSDRESAQMRAEANTLAEDVAVIRAALGL